MDDLRSADVDFNPWSISSTFTKTFPLSYYQPHEFVDQKYCFIKCFLLVASSPLTRSSYHADEDFKKLKSLRDEQTKCLKLQ